MATDALTYEYFKWFPEREKRKIKIFKYFLKKLFEIFECIVNFVLVVEKSELADFFVFARPFNCAGFFAVFP